MPAIKTPVAKILARFAAFALFTPVFCTAAELVIDSSEPLSISPSFTYLVDGAAGSLNVISDGFLFCANVGAHAETPVTLVPQHAQWSAPLAQDVQSVRYNAGDLKVNSNLFPPSTLVCHTAGAQGEQLSPLSEGLFRNSYDSKTAEQYPNLINWISPQGFTWNNPVWTSVPTDPCNPSTDQPAEVVEDTVCAAATGLRPAGASETRAGTMWTGTDGLNFFYVARIDARYGAQTEIEGTSAPHFQQPNQPTSAGSANMQPVDAYSRGVAGVGGGYLGDSGQWCVLLALPGALSSNMCAGAANAGVLNGPLSDLAFSVGVPPLAVQQVSFYLAFIRPIVGAPPSLNVPAAAVSLLVERDAVAAGGDKFKGDDVIFGFLPTSNGFPWMTGGQ